jgi:hypothetical protein
MTNKKEKMFTTYKTTYQSPNWNKRLREWCKENRRRKTAAKSTKVELTNINDKLLELYNTEGMALHFQPSKLKILKEQIERLIMLEQVI